MPGSSSCLADVTLNVLLWVTCYAIPYSCRPAASLSRVQQLAVPAEFRPSRNPCEWVKQVCKLQRGLICGFVICSPFGCRQELNEIYSQQKIHQINYTHQPEAGLV